ncbi:MAG TPA: YceI family protein [Ktedonobacterales bacterium]|nr:YceI family protein [Ktedonobacterales bacterium]
MQTYSISQEQTRVAVAVRRVMSGSGVFSRVTGTVTTGEDGTPQSLDVIIDAGSLQTGIAARDLHLRTATFLGVSQYPLITYSSRRIQQVGPDSYSIHGDLRLHGRTHPVTLDATLDSNVGLDGARYVRVTGLVSSAAFGIPRNPLLRTAMAGMIGDAVHVAAHVFLTPIREHATAATTTTTA